MNLIGQKKKTIQCRQLQRALPFNIPPTPLFPQKKRLFHYTTPIREFARTKAQRNRSPFNAIAQFRYQQYNHAENITQVRAARLSGAKNAGKRFALQRNVAVNNLPRQRRRRCSEKLRASDI